MHYTRLRGQIAWSQETNLVGGGGGGGAPDRVQGAPDGPC